MIGAILPPQEHNSEAQHPYIPIHVETLDKFHTLTNVELVLDNLPAQ